MIRAPLHSQSHAPNPDYVAHHPNGQTTGFKYRPLFNMEFHKSGYAAWPAQGGSKMFRSCANTPHALGKSFALRVRRSQHVGIEQADHTAASNTRYAVVAGFF